MKSLLSGLPGVWPKQWRPDLYRLYLAESGPIQCPIAGVIWPERVADGVDSRVSRGVAQPGRVLALGARCRTFESCRPDHFHKHLRFVMDDHH